jgi:serine/threonine-protein kinase
MSFQIGDIIGTYKIIESLGSGGMGEVFKVEHTITRRIEAMKILTTDGSFTPDHDQRFLREIQLQAKLNHPNIAAVHNAFWQDGHLVMTMELVEGAPLRGMLDTGPLALKISLDYACQALLALDYAHAHGIIHRDISPSNMIVADDGILKLTDFGLAKSPTDLRLTQAGSLLGSLYYMSPEQVTGRATVEARADIYSLGAVLYEMTTGTKVFKSENPFTLMLAHVEQPPVAPSEVNPQLSPGINEIILKALDKDPEKRFQSAELFRCALEGAADAAAESHRPSPVIAAARQGSRLVVLAEPRHERMAEAEGATPALFAFGPAILRSPVLRIAAALVLVAVLSYPWWPSGSPASQPTTEREAAGALLPASVQPPASPSSMPDRAEPVKMASKANANTYASASKPSGMTSRRPTARAKPEPEIKKSKGRGFWRAMGRVVRPRKRAESDPSEDGTR